MQSYIQKFYNFYIYNLYCYCDKYTRILYLNKSYVLFLFFQAVQVRQTKRTAVQVRHIVLALTQVARPHLLVIVQMDGRRVRIMVAQALVEVQDHPTCIINAGSLATAGESVATVVPVTWISR